VLNGRSTSRKRDLLFHEEKGHDEMLVHKENFQPIALSSYTLFMHKNQQRRAFSGLPHTWDKNIDNL
jgi:hypothetical protein